jgi:predicted amidohydrolase YtcJ
MRNFFRLPAALGVLAVALSSGALATESPDSILINGRIFTGAADKLRVEALAVRGERIIATGTTAEIVKLAGPATHKIDLHGSTVIPGINDAHIHLSISPMDAVDVEVKSQDPTWDEMRTALTAAASKARPGALLAAAMGPKLFHDPTVSRAELDKVAPHNPVLIVTLTGHAAFINSAALPYFNIAANQPDPLGGKFERDRDGKLTGVVREYALLQIERLMSDRVPDVEATAELKRQLEKAAAFGITSLQDMSDAASPERAVKLLSAIPAAIRVRIMQMAAATPHGRILKDGHPMTKNAAPNITVNGLKWMLDGVGIEGTFTPRLDLNGPQTPADIEAAFEQLPLTFPASEMPLMLKEAEASHQQLVLHVSGSLAAAGMLQAMEDSGGPAQWATQRVRFEHGDGLTADLLPKVKSLGIVVVQNPTHLAALKQIYGGEFVHLQALKSLLDAGIPLALGSDGPMNPYLNILLASMHPNRPSQAITREQAVSAYTAGSAYAEFAEKDKGTLEPGKLADLAVLSQDIFKAPPPEMPKTKSVLTMVGGKIVYQSPPPGKPSG